MRNNGNIQSPIYFIQESQFKAFVINTLIELPHYKDVTAGILKILFMFLRKYQPSWI